MLTPVSLHFLSLGYYFCAAEGQYSAPDEVDYDYQYYSDYPDDDYRVLSYQTGQGTQEDLAIPKDLDQLPVDARAFLEAENIDKEKTNVLLDILKSSQIDLSGIKLENLTSLKKNSSKLQDLSKALNTITSNSSDSETVNDSFETLTNFVKTGSDEGKN